MYHQVNPKTTTACDHLLSTTGEVSWYPGFYPPPQLSGAPLSTDAYMCLLSLAPLLSCALTQYCQMLKQLRRQLGAFGLMHQISSFKIYFYVRKELLRGTS